jgi:hypothetical protein
MARVRVNRRDRTINVTTHNHSLAYPVLMRDYWQRTWGDVMCLAMSRRLKCDTVAVNEERYTYSTTRQRQFYWYDAMKPRHICYRGKDEQS